MNLENVLQIEIFGRSLGNVGLFALSILAAAVAAKLLYWLFRFQLEKLAAKTETKVDDILVETWEKPVIILTVLGITWFSVDYLKLPPDVLAALYTLFTVVITMVVTVAVAVSYEKLLDYWLTPIAERTESKLDDQLFPIIIKGGKFIIITMGFMIAMSNAGYNIYSLVAGLGVGGIALAMAARETIGHVFGGVSIFADKPFTIGDWVVVDPEKHGWWGKIIKIGLRSTRIRTKYETTLVIPNSILANTVVENISTFGQRRRYSESLWLDLQTTPVKIKQAIAVIEQAIEAVEGTEDGEVHFYQSTLYAHRLRVRFWVNPFNDYHDRIQQVNLLTAERLKKSGIRLARVTVRPD